MCVEENTISLFSPVFVNENEVVFPHKIWLKIVLGTALFSFVKMKK